MNEKRFFLSIVFISILVMGTGVFILSSTNPATVQTASLAKAALIGSANYDWGNILYAGGNVTKTFPIKNTGSQDLQLLNIRTSCHCTKAFVTINGVKSPEFGMDGGSSWIGVVNPGKTASISVIFDPAFHGPQGAGPISRFVSLETNDKDNKQITFTLTGIVINK